MQEGSWINYAITQEYLLTSTTTELPKGIFLSFEELHKKIVSIEVKRSKVVWDSDEHID